MELVLEKNLDEICANKLKQKLDSLIDSKEEIKINACNVEYITSPCIQIIFNAGKSCSVKGINFSIVEQSNILRKAFKSVGLNALLE